ncbi:ABC transporter substrate-binding protein [Paenibacillus sp. FSL R5-0407]|uniref:ABC transporter substrate-binding protein n=1 Tax=Paenibacillus sp. FSL R5-0407 TaxID=2975320 RepID=UPI0030F99EAA
MKTRVTAILAGMIVLSLLISCSPSKETVQYEGDPQMHANLKIMTVDSKDDFMQDYGDLFNAKYPNIELNVVSFQEGNLQEILKQEKPDIFLTSQKVYEQLLYESKLYDLDALLNTDAFNLEGVHQGIVDSLRDAGNGKLYGLPSVFLTKALFYNKDLFDNYGIPYPQDRMTWEEVLQLAARFPAGDGVSGLFMRDFYSLSEDMDRCYGLSKVNVKDQKVTVNTASYKNIFKDIIEAYKAKTVVLPEVDLFEVYDPFITGASAMTVDYYYYINHNITPAKAGTGYNPLLNWDVATAPVKETNRDTSPYFNIAAIFSIHSESEQKQAAWEFVKFVNGEEFAKAKSKTNGFTLPARTDYIYNPEGKNMDAFYSLKPDTNPIRIDYDNVPKGFYTHIKEIISSEAKAVMVGAKTLDEAMVSMQERGQRLLDQK